MLPDKWQRGNMVALRSGFQQFGEGNFVYIQAFTFKQGDSITCTVSKTKICFLKNVPPEL